MKGSQASTLLGVTENATSSESPKAHLTRARLLHPGRLVDGSEDDNAADANNQHGDTEINSDKHAILDRLILSVSIGKRLP
jgi:hypothetical protein